MTAPALHSERARQYVPAAQHGIDSLRAAMQGYRRQVQIERRERRRKSLARGFIERREA